MRIMMRNRPKLNSIGRALMAGLLLGFLILAVACRRSQPESAAPGRWPEAALARMKSPPSLALPPGLVARPEPRPRLHPALSEAEKQWGVEVISLRLTSGGHLIDFRFRVTDPGPAAPLLSKNAKVHLRHARTGALLGVPTAPKTGSLRQKTMQPEKGHIYFVLFANPGRLVKAGDQVEVNMEGFLSRESVLP